MLGGANSQPQYPDDPTEAGEDAATRPELAMPRARSFALLCACCHPALSVSGQNVALLAFCCGWKPAEIASALDLEPSVVHKLIARARRLLKNSRFLDEAPSPALLAERLDAVEIALRSLRQASAASAAWLEAKIPQAFAA